MGGGWLAAHASPACDRWSICRRLPRVHADLLPREGRRRAQVTPYLTLLAFGVVLCAIATWLGGSAAGIGGLVALGAQMGAVALLRPAMTAPQPAFMGRWLA